MAETETEATPEQKLSELQQRYSYAGKIDQEDPPVEDAAPAEEEAKKEETAPEQPDEQPSQKHIEIPSGLLDRAAQVGLGPGDARAFSTAQDLETAVRLLESVKPQQEPPQEAEQQEDPFKPYEVNLDEETVTEDAIVKALQGMAKHQADQTRQVVEYVQNALQQTQQMSTEQVQAQETMRWFDDKITSLGDEATFGKGPTSSLAPGSPELERRQRVMGTIAGVAQTRRDLSEDRIFEMGVQEFLPQNKPAPREAIARPNRTLPSGSDEPFSRVQQLYNQYVRENGDQ